MNSNLQSNASNLVQMIRICIQMLQIFLKSFEFAFEYFESLSNHSNLDSNGLNLTLSNDLNLYSKASSPFWMVRISIQNLPISLEGLEFAFDCFKFLSNG